MYIPKINRFEQEPEILEFIRHHPFATVINMLDGKFWATHVPVELEKNATGEYVLHTHIAKANPQWKSFNENPDVMVIFQGAHAYISASWYDHENVSTWNYFAVHVYGKVRVMEGEEVVTLLDRLVNRHETQEKNPVHVNDLSEKFMASHLKGIVAFEISISDLHAMKKLSQNRDEKNYTVVIDKLQERKEVNSKSIADAMLTNKKSLFKNKK
ncbi:MAG: FMN-binding negative transcriptional regulator [Bacteroidetes bacterium]|nr:FMN-binding negative transcriptional regulator [Bacteroidota bacterium]MBP7399040.1 FMN-binding negative transcriptional regulator [Chitinophagales bacterium]MBK7109000.1 FMN-binding negative transcriptional regulator [Bacteroidota bacterium]MBK8488677.1 FMN-binding negative transcriptional regulator [Bacteroidota bacterium]MBK8681562.1 FMN-binding negative transcriptional regulator [Bacteroidota bacterium]